MSNEKALAEVKPDRKALAEVGKKIDGIAKEYALACKDSSNDYERAVLLATSLIDLRVAVRSYLPVLKKLQGSSLGFKTDKDQSGGYGDDQLVDCAIEAVMRGVRWTNNEFNIIAGKCYITVEGYWRKVTEFPGLTDLRLDPGVPQVINGRTVVPYQATWKLDGRADTIARQLPVITRSGQTDDNTLGKAKRKILVAIYEVINGVASEEGDLVEGQARTVEVANRLPAVANGKTADNLFQKDAEREAVDITK